MSRVRSRLAVARMKPARASAGEDPERWCPLSAPRIPLRSMRATGAPLMTSPLVARMKPARASAGEIRDVARHPAPHSASLHAGYWTPLMTAKDEPPTMGGTSFRLRRLIPLAVIAAISAVVVAMGWHRQLSFETLARHHAVLRDFINAHALAAVGVYIVLYAGAIALSLPVGLVFTLMRRRPFRRRAGRGGGSGGRDHRRNLHLPDRQERVRRASDPPGRSSGAETGQGLSRRCLQLHLVPAPGRDLSVLADQSGAGADGRAAVELRGGDRAGDRARRPLSSLLSAPASKV